MKAMIFAAGVGSRLKPWTDRHPKALVPIAGIPMLQRVIEKIVAADIHDIVVNVHHFADQIRQFLKDNDFGAKITISDETSRLLETGGGLKKALPLFENEPVVVYNADILSDFPLEDMIKAHFAGDSDITLLTAHRETSRFLLVDNQRMMGWTNTSTGLIRPEKLILDSRLSLEAFNGVHIINPNVYSHLAAYKPEDTPFSIIDFYIDFCNKLKISTFHLPARAFWFDIGKPQTLETAQKFISRP